MIYIFYDVDGHIHCKMIMRIYGSLMRRKKKHQTDQTRHFNIEKRREEIQKH